MKRVCLFLMLAVALCSLTWVGRSDTRSGRRDRLAEMPVKSMTEEQQLQALKGLGESVFGPLMNLFRIYLAPDKEKIRVRPVIKYLGGNPGERFAKQEAERKEAARKKADAYGEAYREEVAEIEAAAKKAAEEQQLRIEKALASMRKRWLKKTLWSRKNMYLRSYDKEKNRYSQGHFVKKLSAVKVMDIVASGIRYTPLRFTLQTPYGEEGHLNFDITFFSLGRVFFLEDPKKTHPDWSSKVWSAIENDRVFLGMTTEQARMSWGEPEDINKTIAAYGVHEQWVYSVYEHRYLYFENGILTTIQQ